MRLIFIALFWAQLYNHSEDRHAFQCVSCADLRIFGLTFSESGGDGMCLGGGGMSNLHIKDVISDRNYRQGLTLDGAQGALIENTIFSNTHGTSPQVRVREVLAVARELSITCSQLN
jgi:hypothetical protein